MIQNYHANGKFLLTGEYLVLRGALALALPLKFGQSMSVETCHGASLLTRSAQISRAKLTTTHLAGRGIRLSGGIFRLHDSFVS